MATAPSLIDRLIKKARKHRALVSVASLALISTVALLSLWLHSRYTAAEQARLVQRFGRKVERIESTLWKAQSLELHNTTGLRQSVRERLFVLEQDMLQLGAAAVGPGHAALGRGYLGLGDIQEARRHFEKAISSKEKGTLFLLRSSTRWYL